MGNDYVVLTEKEEMWAKMLMEVLQDNNIPCVTMPVYGAGFSLKTGKAENLRVFVPGANLPLAQELLEALFSADFIDEEDE